MKKIMTVAVAILLVATMAIASFATTTDWEDDRAEGLSVNDREADGTGTDGFNKFRSEFTNSHENDLDRTTNLIIKQDDGNRCVQITTGEAWQTDSFAQGQFAIDIKPNTFGTFQGVFLYQDPYDCDPSELALTEAPYLGTGIGMTIKDKNTVVIYANLDSIITYEFNTGLDLTADFHTYAGYDSKDGNITFAIDEKIVAKYVLAEGKIYNNAGEVVAQGTPVEYDEDTRGGFAFTGTGMDILVDNIIYKNTKKIPAENFVVAGNDDPAPAEDPTPVTPDEPTPVKPATNTADLAVVAILALGAYAVAKKH